LTVFQLRWSRAFGVSFRVGVSTIINTTDSEHNLKTSAHEKPKPVNHRLFLFCFRVCIEHRHSLLMTQWEFTSKSWRGTSTFRLMLIRMRGIWSRNFSIRISPSDLVRVDTFCLFCCCSILRLPSHIIHHTSTSFNKTSTHATR
jgi:hypothetical protein